MRRTASIPELGQRDRFIKNATQTGVFYAVADEEGFARVPSQHRDGCDVTLLWSQQREAERWADALVDNPKVTKLSLADALADTLVAQLDEVLLVGLDWSAGPIEGEFKAGEIAESLRSHTLESFVARAKAAGRIYILEDATGPAMVPCQQEEAQYMPVWASRADAEAAISGSWSKMVALEVPLANFLGLTLPWLAEHGHYVGPDHAQEAGTIEVSPEDLAGRLSDHVKAKVA